MLTAKSMVSMTPGVARRFLLVPRFKRADFDLGTGEKNVFIWRFVMTSSIFSAVPTRTRLLRARPKNACERPSRLPHRSAVAW